ncbi:uncharacterized protein LOC125782292 [Astyanax mexicanus]|uniref:uncharacterized protein LOC125782292 n=1 Tax=Astyanax mexicanus TaxID=7994 RepID=UPI0020CB0FBA|nr:uncharacterized protein LOC125782292 [Astyanax mexicanus]
MAQLHHWCKGEGINPENALLVKDIPDDIEVSFIEETLESVKTLGRVRVRGRMYDPQLESLTVLCECREKVNVKRLPLDVLPSGTDRPWRLVGASAEGTTERDKPDRNPVLSQAELTQTCTPDAIIRAVGELMDKQGRFSGESSAYRRLRTFSGVMPTPLGEEQLDSWLEQARLMVDTCERPDKEKRMRILESLKGPASEIAQAVRFNDSDASSREYIDAIENAFGTPETGEELYFAFRHLCQKPGEKLSEFLRRIEKALNKVVQRGGLPASAANGARLEQLIKGATASDLMLLNLRLRERRNSPPNFLQLLNEIRLEEGYEASRNKLSSTMTSVQVKSARAHSNEMQGLQDEIRELRQQVSDYTSLQPVQTLAAEVHLPPSFKTESSGDDKKVNALKKEVKKLRKQVKVMAVKPATERSAHKLPSSNFNQSSSLSTRSHSDFFCYRCGDDGHVSAKCQAPEDPQKVIQKFIHARHAAKDGKRESTVCSEEDSSKIHVNRGVVRGKSNCIPRGLVGPPSLVQVKVAGKPCTALIDSGSQVTIVFESWYSQHLAHKPLHPLSGLFIWGLSGSDDSYPYRGYIQVDLELPKNMSSIKGPITVLALVCPDPRCSDSVPILLGTNVHTIRPFNSVNKKSNSDQACSMRVCAVAPSTVQPSPSTRAAASAGDRVADVRWPGPGPLVVPATSDHIAICKVKETQSLEKSILITERASSFALPTSVLVQPTVLFSSTLDKNKFLVMLRNESLKDVSIPSGTILAHLQAVDTVTVAQPDKSKVRQQIDPVVFDFANSPIPEEWKERLSKKLAQRVNVFSLEEWDVGLARGVEHRIRLRDDKPFRERSRRIAPADLDDLRRHLQGLLAAGIIKESRSPYASPIVLARKKSGQLRMCVDYRTLNRHTIPDQYVVPRIDEALDCLSGSKWFSVLDLRSGYYQIPMADEDKEKTAFICPLGFFQFQRMPQGVTGAPATFQRLMERAVGDMHMLEVIVYLDDLIVFGKSLAEHEERLLKVLDRLEESGLKLSIDKCQFCRSQVTYVGHIVSEQGIATDPAKIEAVAAWKQPTDLASLQSFLGFCGYYRRFIKSYSIIVRPLTELTKGYPPTQKGRKSSKTAGDKTYFKIKEPFGDRWDESCTQAFNQIIHCLTHAPVLAFADPAKPYVLHIDASLHGLGAVLNQEYPEGLRPVAFASRKLSSSEKNYPVHQLEFLALKWAVVDKFHDYLYGASFTVRTDNNPLTYVLTTAKLNATGHRWLAALSAYNFTVQYRPGCHNIDADSLSRNVFSKESGEWRDMSSDSIKALCKQVRCAQDGISPNCAVFLGIAPAAIPDCYAFPTHLNTGCLELQSSTHLKNAQDSDPIIAPIKKSLIEGSLQMGDKGESRETALLRREGPRLRIIDGLLYRVVKRTLGTDVRQLVLPKVYFPMVLRSLHDECGHLGVEKTAELIRNRFYWPKMSADIEQYVKNCGRCIARKTLPQRAAPLNKIPSQGPLDLVCIDFLSLEPDTQGFGSILVVTDSFTRYAQAFPTKDQKASTVAKVLFEKYFVHYGLPARIHSDQGRDFESKLIHELLRMLGIRKSRTTPYHPQGDPQPERFNRTLLSMLGTLDPRQKQRWSQKISQLVHAYNCTRNDATGYSPYLLMFGREARLPVDLCFGVGPEGEDNISYQNYVARLRSELHDAYKLATDAAVKNHERNKKFYDRLVKEQVLAKGDRVLLRNFGVTGKHKLQNKWRIMPYVVVGKMENLPVYRVKPESGGGEVKTVHRNHLLPIGCLVRMPVDEDAQSLPKRPVTRRQQRQRESQTASGGELQDREVVLSADESEDSEIVTFYPVAFDSEQILHDLLQCPDLRARVQESSATDGHKISSANCTERAVETRDDTDHTPEVVDAETNPTLDPFPETDLAGGVEAESVQESVEADMPSTRPSREKRPVQRLTYDELGEPSSYPLNTLSMGVLVGYGTYLDAKNCSSQTIWCHPMALCSGCAKKTKQKL